MKQLQSVLILLLGFLTTGRSLSCLHCSSNDTNDCPGMSRECSPDATSCIKSLEITTTVNKKEEKSFMRGCNNDEHVCDRDFRMNIGRTNQQRRVINKCCNTDNCNKCKMKVPPYNETANELLCPVCHQTKTNDCDSFGYIRCRGDENECIDFAGTLLKQDESTVSFSAMGCITPEGCELLRKIFPTAKIIQDQRFKCTAAHPVVL